MWNRLSRADRRVLLIAAIFFALFSYLLFNDRLITNWSNKNGLVVAEIYKVENDVRQKSAGDFKWNSAKTGVIYFGDSIFTGPNSEVFITLYDQSVIHLRENSLLTFSQINNQLTLGLKFGHISGSLKTAIAIAGYNEKFGKMGHFDITSSGGGKVATRRPSSVTNLPTPEITQQKVNYTVDNVTPLILSWNPTPGATLYTVEVSTNPQFRKSQKYTTPVPSLTLQNIKAGQLYYRVTATNPALLTKSPPSLPGEIISQQMAPSLIPVEPKHHYAKSLQDLGAPTNFNLKWTHHFENTKYQVQISQTPNFEKPIELKSRTPSSVLNIHSPGQYYWRVRSLSSTDQPLSDFSKIGEINYALHKPLPAPMLMEPLANMTLFFQNKKTTPFWLEWQSVSYAKTYALEIATDSLFKNKIVSKQLHTSRYLNQIPLNQQELYWRVKALSPVQNSEWSEARRMSVFSGRSARIN